MVDFAKTHLLTNGIWHVVGILVIMSPTNFDFIYFRFFNIQRVRKTYFTAADENGYEYGYEVRT